MPNETRDLALLPRSPSRHAFPAIPAKARIHLGLALALLCSPALGADEPVTTYPPLQRYHELALETFAAYRQPEARRLSRCPVEWATTAPADIKAKLVEHEMGGGVDFMHRLYQLEDGSLCGIIDGTERHLLTAPELKQLLEDLAAHDRYRVEANREETAELEREQAAQRANAKPPSPPTAEQIEAAELQARLAAAQSKWQPLPEALLALWTLQSKFDANARPVPLSAPATMRFRSTGYEYADGCITGQTDFGAGETLLTSLNCDRVPQFEPWRADRYELDGTKLTLYEIDGGSVYVLERYPYSMLTERGSWRMREIRAGDRSIDLGEYRYARGDPVIAGITFEADSRFRFEDIDRAEYTGEFKLFDKTISRMHLDDASSARARASDQSTREVRTYSPEFGRAIELPAPRTLIKRIDWPAIDGWRIVSDVVDGSTTDVLELVAGDEVYRFW